MVAFYNEIDPAAAHILAHQIARGVIAPGIVDTRSIKELRANDLKGFTQVHLFAGGGLWSVAARLARWPDARPIWTASCPCQPFSQAGKGRGTDDERHLWPDVAGLLDECREAGCEPPVIVGEQVAGKAGYDWFDGVRADLAKQGYGARVVDIPACAVDAPHIRQRLYWCAVADCASDGWEQGQSGTEATRYGRGSGADDFSREGAVADADRGGCAGRQEDAQRRQIERAAVERTDDVEHASRVGWSEGRAEHELRGGRATAASADASGGLLPNAGSFGRQEAFGGSCNGFAPNWQEATDSDQRIHFTDRSSDGRNGTHWSDAEWITCHDGKARRAKPGLRLLVNGVPGRVDLWRVGGNAIVPQVAAEVIAALMDVLPDWRAAA